MKLILVLWIPLIAFPALAADFICEKRVTPTRVEFAAVDTWPDLRVLTASKDCIGDENFGFCVENGGQPVVGDREVCGYRMNTNRECRSDEFFDGRNRVYEMDCPRARIRARMQVSNHRARLVCTRNGRVEQTWSYDDCR